jgi:hypothetical protein
VRCTIAVELEAVMIVMAVVGSVIVVMLVVAGLYDYRQRRRGRRQFKLTANKALQHRVDADARANPFFTGGQDWMPPGKRDPR